MTNIVLALLNGIVAGLAIGIQPDAPIWGTLATAVIAFNIVLWRKP